MRTFIFIHSILFLIHSLHSLITSVLCIVLYEISWRKKKSSKVRDSQKRGPNPQSPSRNQKGSFDKLCYLDMLFNYCILWCNPICSPLVPTPKCPFSVMLDPIISIMLRTFIYSMYRKHNSISVVLNLGCTVLWLWIKLQFNNKNKVQTHLDRDYMCKFFFSSFWAIVASTKGTLHRDIASC